ncbi:MAG TPA: hypothetical protein PLF09_08390 [Thiotrichales bacterium]|nr:MAG: hypothetical protein B7Y72_02680 [Mehylophilales bacterium 35-46-6]HQR96600.1 hypothetical protein [Thiotrichales bacterium]
MVETKAQFAKRLGVNKSTVTRYGQAGRLVLAPNGKVKVEESLRLINATKGHRIDVSQLHGQNHQGLQNDATGVADDDMSATVETVGMDRATLQAQALTYGNKMLELEAAKVEGTILDKEDFLKQVGLSGRSYRIGIERLIDNLAPVLVNVHGTEARLETISRAVSSEFL